MMYNNVLDFIGDYVRLAGDPRNEKGLEFLSMLNKLFPRLNGKARKKLPPGAAKVIDNNK